MTPERITNARLGESYYKKTLDNGLTVYVYPMPRKSSAFAVYGVNAGSVDREFSLDGRRVKAPAGTAHFLEHKMFESEQGDAFSLFAETGASANAFTSFDRTCYLFAASFDIERSLDILVSFVNSFKFTEQTVAKEQGIIGQEIKMYLDSPEWKLLFMLLQTLYKNNPVRDDIAGSVDSIATITPQLLYDCCEAYYRPENMALAVAGNVDPESVFALCERKLHEIKSYGSSAEYFIPDEPDEINGDSVSDVMDINAVQFCLGFKELAPSAENRLYTEIVSDMLLEIIAGDASELYKRLYNDGLINGTFGTEAVSGRGYLCNTFAGESRDPEKTAALIREEIERVKREGIAPERFEQTRRSFIGDEICDFDSADETADSLICAHFRGKNAFDALKIYESITKEELEGALKGMLRQGRFALAVVRPKEKE